MHKISPLSWLVLGVVGFPVLALGTEMLGWFGAALLGLFKTRHFPEFGWGGLLGLFLGGPLGAVSGLCSMAWRNKQYFQARAVAALGGLSIGGGWLLLLLHCDPFVWIGDFGFAVTPLAWAAGLILFAAGARSVAPSGELAE